MKLVTKITTTTTKHGLGSSCGPTGLFLKVAHKEALSGRKICSVFYNDGKNNSFKCSFLIVEGSFSTYKCIAY